MQLGFKILQLADELAESYDLGRVVEVREAIQQDCFDRIEIGTDGCHQSQNELAIRLQEGL
jgi:hypothetical protein